MCLSIYLSICKLENEAILRDFLSFLNLTTFKKTLQFCETFSIFALDNIKNKVHNPLRLPRESTSERPKVVRTPCAFNILTSKCASRHNGVHFFDISTAKGGSEAGVCFVHFDFEMCSALHRRAIFHLSSGQLAPHPRLWRAYFSTLRSPKSLEKRSVSRLSYLFAHLRLLSSEAFFFFFSSLLFLLFSSLLFSSLLFSSLTLTTSAFHLSILSEVWLLNFLRLRTIVAFMMEIIVKAHDNFWFLE